MQKQERSVKEIVEKRLLPILSVIVILASAIRSAAAWSGGTFNLNLLPHPMVRTIDAVIGISLAALMEMVMVLAGMQWFDHIKAELEAKFDKSLPAFERKMQAEHHHMQGAISFVFSIIGGVCSVIGQMYFALTQGVNLSPALECAGAVLMTVCIFYAFVIHQPIRESVTKYIEQDMATALTGILHSIGDRIKVGEHSNSDIRTLQRALPYGQRKILEALVMKEANETMWDVGTIALKLGMDDETGKRAIRRRIAKAKEDVSYGIQEKQDGRGYEMPMSSAIRLFETEFNERIANGQQRTPAGQLIALNPEIFGDEAAANGH